MVEPPPLRESHVLSELTAVLLTARFYALRADPEDESEEETTGQLPGVPPLDLGVMTPSGSSTG